MDTNVSSGTSAIESAITSSTTIDLNHIKNPIHFIGIGGIGMSALARLALARGIAVSGSDNHRSATTDLLEKEGAKIFIGHKGSNVERASVVVISTAITKENVEVAEACKRGLPIIHRSDMLRELTRQKELIGVSGTHGKTTTTGMVAQVLLDGSLDPSIIVGGIFSRIGSNSRHGEGRLFVAEIDESDGTQTGVESHISVITNIEGDHLENYPGGLDEIRQSMMRFALNSKDSIIVCSDDAGCRTLLRELEGETDKRNLRVITYGARRENGSDGASIPDYSFRSAGPFIFEVFKHDKCLGSVRLGVPGEHNKYNALVAVIVGLEKGLDFPTIATSLSQFSGVNRRFQILGHVDETTVVDDYAHHPTEVVAVLGAAQDFVRERANGKRVVALFQPHQPGRLQNHWHDFLAAFKDADLLLVSEIYVARGNKIEGVTSSRFVEEIDHPNVYHLEGPTSELAEKVLPFLRSNDLLLTIGAGDVTSVGPKVIELLSARQ